MSDQASVIDTNVLIVASAADEGSAFQPGATPIEEAHLRQRVLQWLQEFEQDGDRHVVLDWDWHICNEYKQKLSQEQDYGWLVIMQKRDRNEVVWVGFEVDSDGNASLPAPLAASVPDLADRKMVAAALSAIEHSGDCQLVNACDTDWVACEVALQQSGIRVNHLLEDWVRGRHAEKLGISATSR